MPGATATERDFLEQARKKFSRLFMSRRFAFVLAALAVVSGVATFGLFTGTSTGTGTPDVKQVMGLLIIDLVLLLMLSAIIAQRIVAVWVQHRQGTAGSALHVRLVMMFSLVAVTPAILVAVFATLFLNFGMESWFSSRVKTAVDASQAVASAYLDEHMRNIRADTLSLANDLNRDAAQLSLNPILLSQVLTNQAALRGLTEASVLGVGGEVLARSRFTMTGLEVGTMPPDALARANEGELIILTARNTDQVRALLKLERFIGSYLLVGRFVDAQVINNMNSVREAAQSYLNLEERQGVIQITFVAIFGVIALLLLLASVWIGMTFATQLVRPISNLIVAAQGVSAGDLSQRVEVEDAIGEIGSLSQAFNVMTGKLVEQQDGLLQMNRQLDERRRFTETVLGGVSAGVIGLDKDGRVTLTNRSASQLLGHNLEASKGRHLAEVVPEMSEILAEAMDRPERIARAEIHVAVDGVGRTLTANATAEQLEGEVIGYVVTFDDITELQSAQRKAAWSGVARRIAHEIKNPLTPIQLSAERLKRKYLAQIKDDPETFSLCTDTIVRQVGELERMVDEFSSFARMPQAVLKTENLSNICRQAAFLEKNRGDGLTLETRLPDEDVIVECDLQQISRALTNILKNAAESVAERVRQEEGRGLPGWIRLELARHDTPQGSRVIICVQDNGAGLPEMDLARLTEPYVTTRDKGTGLGLAIVKKIMEDHGGDLVLENRLKDEHGGGARVALSFPPQVVRASE